MAKNTPKKNKDEAKKILKDVERESAGVIDSHVATGVEKMKTHFAGADNPEDDNIEVWGKRIGRFLSVIFAAYLVYYLYGFFTRGG